MMMASPRHNSMRLSQLLEGLLATPLQQDPEITGIAVDSRKVEVGNVFIALSGSRENGMDYINDALQAGAVAVLLEADSQQVEGFPGPVPIISVTDLRHQMGDIAARYYQHPTQRLKLIGVTGTNGKTSICHILADSLQHLQQAFPCGVIGTLGYGLFGKLGEAPNTTPDAIIANQLLASMLRHGARRVVMEVSSHGLQQGRVEGLQFDTAMFTNLTRDHLDYHGTMKVYGMAKQSLFLMPGLRNAVINLDDAFGRELLENLPSDVRVYGYSVQTERNFSSPRCHTVIQAQSVSCTRRGLQIQLQVGDAQAVVNSRLMGDFNASNLLACVAALLSQGFELPSIVTALDSVSVVPGRLEAFAGDQRQPLVIVDYAHSPDGLKQALSTLRGICDGKLICVFGCGGDRDRGKRPLMGKIAAELADRIILTNDNPRGEDPSQILSDISSGIPESLVVEQIVQRERAIETAIAGAGQQDVVLIAGKGHEDYQLVGNEVLAFSDRELVRRILNGGGDD